MSYNNYNIEDLSFFNEQTSKDLKLQRNSSSDRFAQPFAENLFDNVFDFPGQKWNSFPIILDKDEDEIKNEDDNSSNLADTEEHASSPVSNKKDLETEHSSDSIKFNEKKVTEIADLINQPSTDINAFLSEVLTAGPTDPQIKRKRTVTKTVKAKRVRKTKDQVESLTQEYALNSEWTSEDITALAVKLNLTNKQVYKWYWDQRISQGDLKPKNW